MVSLRAASVGGPVNQSSQRQQKDSTRVLHRSVEAAPLLGPDHGVTKALARAALTMAKVDLWRARLAVKTLRRDQREAIARTPGTM